VRTVKKKRKRRKREAERGEEGKREKEKERERERKQMADRVTADSRYLSSLPVHRFRQNQSRQKGGNRREGGGGGSCYFDSRIPKVIGDHAGSRNKYLLVSSSWHVLAHELATVTGMGERERILSERTSLAVWRSGDGDGDRGEGVA